MRRTSHESPPLQAYIVPLDDPLGTDTDVSLEQALQRSLAHAEALDEIVYLQHSYPTT